ncbi:MAG: hypothetical protein HY751_02850 [Nitrospinae bacterium]|nr:hypothetical protein [Nitrospinota bacterium]
MADKKNNNNHVNRAQPTDKQLVYANMLDVGVKIGWLILVTTFTLYVSGIMPPHVPLDKLPELWKLPVNEYLHEAGLGAGWSWAGMLHKGDMLNFVGVAFLSGVTIACFLRIMPLLARKKDTIYLAIVILEIGVLSLAASGILTAGGH